MSKLFSFFCFIFLCTVSLYSDIDVHLNGYLSQSQLDEAFESINSSPIQDNAINVYINSTTGNLSSTINFAKNLHKLKQQRNFLLAVYIEEYAVGPAALIPFLADKLYLSSFVTWGDLRLDSEYGNKNILKSIAQNLIPKNHSQNTVLAILSNAMIDPSTDISSLDMTINANLEDTSDEGLVISHTEIIKLGLGNYYTPITKSNDQDILDAPKSSIFSNIPILPGKEYSVGHIYVGDKTSMINQATWIYIKAALEYYRQSLPHFIILHLNTPGGEVFSSQQISDALKEFDDQTGIPIVALIDDWAISAGAMLAYSCRYIVTTPSGSMGAAAPVIQSSQGMVAASEKITSALRSDFANRAAFYNRDPLLAQAMVDKDIILVQRANSIIRLDDESNIKTSGISPDTIISRKDKLLTLTAKEMLLLGVATAQANSASAPYNKQDIPKQNNISLFSHPHFSQASYKIDAYQMDWKMQFIALLLHPAVASLLFLGLMLGLYMEISTPGFGVPGIIGLSCLFLISLSSFAHVSLPILEFIIIALGLALLVVELFILPGFGIAGLLGFIFFIGGVIALLLPELSAVEFTWDTQTLNEAGKSVINRLVFLIAALFTGLAIIILSSKWILPIIQKSNPLIHHGEEDKEKGYNSHKNTLLTQVPVGSKGKAASILRPSGKVEIEGQVFEAYSQHGFIPQNQNVIVTEIKSNMLIVKAEKE